jgi:hypothetical protein
VVLLHIAAKVPLRAALAVDRLLVSISGFGENPLPNAGRLRICFGRSYIGAEI